MKGLAKVIATLSMASLSLCLLAAGCTQSAPAAANATSAALVNTTSSPSGNQNAASVNMPSFADLLDSVETSVVQINITAMAQFGRRTVQQQGEIVSAAGER